MYQFHFYMYSLYNDRDPVDLHVSLSVPIGISQAQFKSSRYVRKRISFFSVKKGKDFIHCQYLSSIQHTWKSGELSKFKFVIQGKFDGFCFEGTRV